MRRDRRAAAPGSSRPTSWCPRNRRPAPSTSLDASTASSLFAVVPPTPRATELLSRHGNYRRCGRCTRHGTSHAGGRMIRTCGVFLRRSFAGWLRRWSGSTTRGVPSRARERIPADRPLVFVLNHPNGLLDPLVLRVATGRPARFLAKSTLFSNPLGRLAMDAFGSIPIYRAHESGRARRRRRRRFAQRRQLRALPGGAGGGRRAGALSRGGLALRPPAPAAEDGRGAHRAVGRGRARRQAGRHHRPGRSVLRTQDDVPVVGAAGGGRAAGGRAAAGGLPARRARRGDGADRDDRRAAGRGRAAGGDARAVDRDRARRGLDARA